MVAYSRTLADLILEGLADGKTLRAVCRGDGMPSHVAVLQWRKGDVDGFRSRYEEARTVGYEMWADECVELADETAADPGAVQKARLRFDARRWLLSKALPKFGDRVTVAGDPDAPLVIEDNRAPISSFLMEFAGRVVSAEPAPSPTALAIPQAVIEPAPPDPAPKRAAPRRAQRVVEPDPEPLPPPRRTAPEPVDPLAAFRGTGMSDAPEYPDR